MNGKRVQETSNKIPKIMRKIQELTMSENRETSKDMQQIICVLSQLNIAVMKDENDEFVYEYELPKAA